ncbi:hypothetical protein PG991_013876 [Apiospora marii]|uniref:Uncharacterized protein n=1 Tax=Apiospora marii TaxID=335849 RepID=A0ABR1R7D1_9PEZI
MDNQRSVESGLAAPGRTLVAGSQAHIPALLRIPQEIRDQIYSYFVTIGQDYDHEGALYHAGETIDVTILHINREIREEAWESLVRKNLWVRVTIPASEQLGPFDLGIPYNQVPEEHFKRLVAKADIHLSLGLAYENNDSSDLDGNESSDSFLFAYHPFHYNYLLQRLAENFLERSSIAIQLTPATLINSSMFTKLLEPLCVLRNMRNVSFDGVELCPALQSLARDMKRSLIIRDKGQTEDRVDMIELIEIQQFYQRRGRNAESQGRYSNAMCYYKAGYYATDISPDTASHMEGSPEYSTCCNIDTEFNIDFSRSLHRYVTQLEKSVPNHTLEDHMKAETIDESITACCSALNFVGISDCQRREAHLYRAFALFRVAEYLRTLPEPDRQSSSYGPRSYYNYYSQLPHPDSREAAYAAAARDLFYAKNVTPSHDILADLEEEDKAMYRKLGFFTGPGYPIASHEVPLLGTWSGDPTLWASWKRRAPRRYLLMKLFRLRLNQEPDDKVEDMEVLKKHYAAEGITWSWEDGHLRITSTTW